MTTRTIDYSRYKTLNTHIAARTTPCSTSR